MVILSTTPASEDPEPDIGGYTHYSQHQTHIKPQTQPQTPIINESNANDVGDNHNQPEQGRGNNAKILPAIERVRNGIDNGNYTPVLKTRSWPGRARTLPNPHRDDAGGDKEEKTYSGSGSGEQGTHTPSLTTARLAPLKKLTFPSLPLPPRMGPPEPEVKVKREIIEPTWKQSFKNTVKSQPALVAVPVLIAIAWSLHFSHQNPVAVFVTCLLAIVPLAGGLGFATEELASRVGEAWGGLLNASFGNAVELLIAILALVKGEIDIVQASMVGSILSNVLLVLGMSYFAGGLRFHEQLYTIIGAQMHISLLGLSLMAIVLPAAYHTAYPNVSATISATRRGNQPEGEELANLLKMSRGLSFMLLAVYAMFLTFQLYTHAYLFRIPREKMQHPLPGPVPQHEHVFPVPRWGSSSSSSSSSTRSSISGRSSRGNKISFKRFRRGSVLSRKTSTSAGATVDREMKEEQNTSPRIRRVISPAQMSEKPPSIRVGDEDGDGGITTESPNSTIIDNNNNHTNNATLHSEVDHDLERGLSRMSSSTNSSLSSVMIDDDGVIHVQPKVKFIFALCTLLLMTALAGVTAEFLVDSIDGLTATGNVSREFVGLILLPVIGNSVEHITAVTVSVKDKLNLSMSIAVGSSIQVSLCLLPILVLIGWAIGQPMLLFFDSFETITLVISVLLVNFAISDGRTNYLEGFVLMVAYLAIALVCWFYDPAV